MIENENLLLDFGLKLQDIITNYQSLYDNTDVGKKEFLRVSAEPLNDEIARLNVNTINEMLIGNDMIIDHELLLSINKLSLQAVIDFGIAIK